MMFNKGEPMTEGYAPPHSTCECKHTAYPSKISISHGFLPLTQCHIVLHVIFRSNLIRSIWKRILPTMQSSPTMECSILDICLVQNIKFVGRQWSSWMLERICYTTSLCCRSWTWNKWQWMGTTTTLGERELFK